MAQTVLLYQDFSNDGWYTSTGSTLRLYQMVDEAVPDDLDNIRSTDGICILKFDTAYDPGVHTGHLVRVRSKKSTSGASTLRVSLLEGSTSIASWNIEETPGWVTKELALSEAQAALIGDYANLRLQLRAISGSPTRLEQVSWAQFETPNAPLIIVLPNGFGGEEFPPLGGVGHLIGIDSIQTGESFGASIVGSDRFVPTSIESAEAWGTPYVGETGVILVELEGYEIPSAEEFGDFDIGAQWIALSSVASGEEWGSITAADTLILDSILSTEGWESDLTWIPGPATFVLDSIESAEEFSEDPRFHTWSAFFRDNLLRFLPIEFELRDESIEDLENFLAVVALPLDDLKTYVEEFDSIFDVDSCDPKYLPLLANLINYPISDFDPVPSQRRQVRTAVSWYKSKGLSDSLRALFYSFGYEISVVELWTEDYKDFFPYPGTFVPVTAPATLAGKVSDPLEITDANRTLRIKVNRTVEVLVTLTLGSRTAAQIVAEIDAALDPVEADCVLVSSPGSEEALLDFEISTRAEGADAELELIETTTSVIPDLNFDHTQAVGINAEVPSDWSELLENGGTWFKSPHFGIEAAPVDPDQLITTDESEEFRVIRDRIELVRPAHTVLDWIRLIQKLEDAFLHLGDSLFVGTYLDLYDTWPLPVCYTRNSGHYNYLRDGEIEDRSTATNEELFHTRHLPTPLRYRDGTVSGSASPYITFWNLSRSYASGPPQMADRGTWGYHYRGGYGYSAWTRGSCSDSPELEATITGTFEEEPQVVVFRSAGLYHRDNPTDYVRDGTFTELTWRGQCQFTRRGANPDLTRAVYKSMLDEENYLMFVRSDLSGVYFRDLVTLNDPESLGIFDQIQWPGELP